MFANFCAFVFVLGMSRTRVDKELWASGMFFRNFYGRMDRRRQGGSDGLTKQQVRERIALGLEKRPWLLVKMAGGCGAAKIRTAMLTGMQECFMKVFGKSEASNQAAWTLGLVARWKKAWRRHGKQRKQQDFYRGDVCQFGGVGRWVREAWEEFCSGVSIDSVWRKWQERVFLNGFYDSVDQARFSKWRTWVRPGQTGLQESIGIFSINIGGEANWGALTTHALFSSRNIFLVQESRGTTSATSAGFPSGWRFIGQRRTEAQGGGCGIAFDSGIWMVDKVEAVGRVARVREPEWIVLRVRHKSTKVLACNVVSVYFPPGACTLNALDEFFGSVKTLTDTVPVFVGGDFNYDIASDPILSRHGMVLYSSREEATLQAYNGGRPRLVDYIWGRLPMEWTFVGNTNEDCGLDHRLIGCTFNHQYSFKTKGNAPRIKFRRLRKNPDLVRSLRTMFDVVAGDADGTLENISQQCLQAAVSVCGVASAERSNAFEGCEWWTPGLTELKRAAGAPGASRTLKRQFSKAVKKAKQDYFWNLMQESGVDRDADSIKLGIFSNWQRYKRSARTLYHDSEEQFEVWSDIFGSAPDGEMDKYNEWFREAMERRVQNWEDRAQWVPFTVGEVKRAFEGLPLGKAADATGATYEILRLLPDELLEKVTGEFNRIMAMERPIPADWKDTIVSLIPKPHAVAAGDFRPISLMSVWGKAMEELVLGRLKRLGRLTQDSQQAFMEGTSAEDQVWLLATLDQYYAAKRRKPLFVINLDLRKAYDTMPHEAIMATFAQFGEIPIEIVLFVNNWIRGHRKSLLVPELQERWIQIQRGVGQGSKLSPLLFNVFFDSLLRVLQDFGKEEGALEDPVMVPAVGDKPARVLTNVAFADDIKILFTNPEDGRKLLELVREWEDLTGMRFGPAKSEGITLGQGQQHLDISFKDVQIPWKDSVEILGVFFSSKRHEPTQHHYRCDKLLEETIPALRVRVGPQSGCSTRTASQIVRQIVWPTMLYGTAIFPIQEILGDKIVHHATNAVLGTFKTSSSARKHDFLGWKDWRYLQARRVVNLAERLENHRIPLIQQMFEYLMSLETSLQKKGLHWLGYLERSRAVVEEMQVREETRKENMSLKVAGSNGWIPYLFSLDCFNPKDVCLRNNRDACTCRCLICGEEGSDHGSHLWSQHQLRDFEQFDFLEEGGHREGMEWMAYNWNISPEHSRKMLKRMTQLWDFRRILREQNRGRERGTQEEGEEEEQQQ